MQLVRLTTCADGFEARLVAARLGSEGVVWSLRGAHDGPLAIIGTVDVLVDANDLDVAREVLGDTVDDGAAVAPGRLPDFLIIGAMKSGTTTLFRWLEAHPDVSVAEQEPHFFSSDPVWAKGVGWYASLFAGAPDDVLTGEASATSTDLRRVDVVAERMAAVVPDARLVYLVREPVARLRSHYRDAVLRGREHRLLADALRDPEVRYVTSGLYQACLQPFLDRFPAAHVLVVPLDDLAPPAHVGWYAVLEHLGLDPVEPPGTRHDRTTDRTVPTRLRRLLAPFGNRAPAMGERLASADGPVPDHVVDRLYDDAERLAATLHREPFWPRPDRP